VSQKNVTLFIFLVTLSDSDVVQFCQFLAETYLREFETDHICTAHHTSSCMVLLKLVKTNNNFYCIHYYCQHSIKYEVFI